MFRLALLILILAALVVLALQNLLPVIPLVFLGMQTQALPLAVWVVGAIAAGAGTTIVLALLIRLAGARTGSRSRRPQPRRASGRSSGAATGDRPWTPPPWTGDRNAAQPVDSGDRTDPYGGQPGRASSSTDDWEQPRQSFEAWDNWDDSRPPVDAPRRVRPAVRTVIQDAAYRDVTEPSVAYQPPYREPTDTSWSYRAEEQDEFRDEYQPPAAEGDREEWDDWEEEELRQPTPTTSPSPAAKVEPEPPPRNIVEIQREPQGGYQTGSVFSYTYRSSNPLADQLPPPSSEPDFGPELESNPEPEDVADEVADELANLTRVQPEVPSAPSSASSRSVYDAEFRVLIPPYSPTPEPSDSPEPPAVEPIVEPERTVESPLTSYPQASDDWDEDDTDDIDDFSPDPPRREPPREPPSRHRMTPDSLEREVWDDWDDDDEPDDPPPPPSTSPEGNPPLRLG